MTPAQLTTFKAAINGDSNLTALLTAGDQGGIAAYYNTPSGAMVWKPVITIQLLNTAIVWSEFIVLTALKQNAYFAMTSTNIDATSANIRAGFSSVFGASTTLNNLTAIAQRQGTRFENLFASGNVVPNGLFGLNVQPQDIADALALG